MEEENKNEIIEIDENEEVVNTLYDVKKEEVVESISTNPKKNKKPSKWSKLSKKQKTIIIVSIVVVVLVVVALLLYFLIFKKDDNHDDGEPAIVIENDNYRYEDGTLVLLDKNKSEVGKYKCENKDEELCFVAYYSDEDEFDVDQKVYEDDTKLQIRSSIYKDNYAFIYDNSTKIDKTVKLYNISKKEVVEEYDLVKKVNDELAIVAKDKAYGVIKLDGSDITNVIESNYDYLGFIEDTNLIVATKNKKTSLIDFNGKSQSSSVTGKIMSFDNDSISAKSGSSYSVYDYSGNVKISDKFDYVRFADTYILTVKNNGLDIYDYEGIKLNGEAIKINGSNYNTKLIFNEELRQVGKKSVFEAYASDDVLKVELEDETIKVNLYESAFNKNITYVSYNAGKLNFYSDLEKTKKIGTYSCDYANNVNSNTESLDYCFVARASSIVHDYESGSNKYLPIYNERYVFITDTKTPNANNNIKLWDLKQNKSLASYAEIDSRYEPTGENVDAVETDGTLVFARKDNGSYGVIKISKNSVNSVIPFKKGDITNKEMKMLDNYILIKRSDDTYHLYEESGNEITKNITTTYEIVEYKDNKIKVINKDKEFVLYNLDGTIAKKDNENEQPSENKENNIPSNDNSTVSE